MAALDPKHLIADANSVLDVLVPQRSLTKKLCRHVRWCWPPLQPTSAAAGRPLPYRTHNFSKPQSCPKLSGCVAYASFVAFRSVFYRLPGFAGTLMASYNCRATRLQLVITIMLALALSTAPLTSTRKPSSTPCEVGIYVSHPHSNIRSMCNQHF